MKPGALTALLQEVAASPEKREEEPLSLPPGTVIGRFEIIRELGRGGFGVVYEAKDRDLGRPVAVKVVRPGRITEEEGKGSREAEAIARLSHPNLITLFEVGRSEHGPFLVFELLRGKTLDLRIEEGTLPIQEAVHVATEVARGLAHAHAEGVIHRDLKPANVFVTNKGQVKVLDFGMAHAFGRRRLSGGTPAYMAPEQWEDDPEDERTDVFALGVMLYRMLTGEYPFPEGKGKWSSEPATLRKLDVPGAPDLAELVEKTLDRTPKGRPRDGAAVLAALTPIEDRLRAKPADGQPLEHAKRRKATFGDLLAELKRRHVFRVMVGYGIFSFAVLQVTEPIMHGAGLQDWVLKAVLVALALGFPVAVILAWVYDLTAQGVKRTPTASGPPLSRSSRFLMPLSVSVTVLAIVGAGGGAWYAWKQSGERGKAAPTVAPSIAVLPFADMSPQHDQEYFADGVAEEILGALGRVVGLRVIGRTSSFAFRGKNEDIVTIAQKLRVGVLLEGSVRREGDRVRVSAKLINASDGVEIWSERYDRKLTAVFAVQDEIAKAVVDALQMKLMPGQTSGRHSRLPSDPEVYRQYLLGRDYTRRGYQEKDQHLAAEAYGKAIAADAAYAPAWAGLSTALLVLADYASTPEESTELRRRSLEAAEKAVELDPRLPDGYLARALIRQVMNWDFSGARADIDRAVALAPSDVRANRDRGQILSVLGHFGDAVETLRKVVDLDPLDGQAWTMLGSAMSAQGDIAGARVAFERARAIIPDGLWNYLGELSLLEGQPAAALAAFERAPEGVWRTMGIALARHDLGQEQAAQGALDTLTERYADNWAYQIAGVHAWRGEHDAAFAWLDRAYRQRDGGLLAVKFDVLLRRSHGDPRYAALLRQLNLPVD